MNLKIINANISALNACRKLLESQQSRQPLRKLNSSRIKGKDRALGIWYGGWNAQPPVLHQLKSKRIINIQKD
ncbi:MAG: hypothetical protein K940chlam3_01008 [Chlamydiae bacterium]|nr:hypothetical protein [Chlamydiota bacterium]